MEREKVIHFGSQSCVSTALGHLTGSPTLQHLQNQASTVRKKGRSDLQPTHHIIGSEICGIVSLQLKSPGLLSSPVSL